MESVGMTPGWWRGRRVFLTGHTGFKGGWLALWLTDMGAQVHGYSLAPPTSPSFFEVCRMAGSLASSVIADIRDLAALKAAVQAAKPEVIFHLAAQPLVRRSYRDPLETIGTNVLGTAHVLSAALECPGVRALVNVTTDKCYENIGSGRPFLEGDRLGGTDPYSCSKACAELVTAAYREAFCVRAGLAVATARAGNVIGGGDWAEDRLIPDFLRCLDRGQPLAIRAPTATRPWQHVLEPLSGYLILAQRLAAGEAAMAGAWNFGPEPGDAQPVRWVVERMCERVAGASWRIDSATDHRHEAHLLELDSTKARTQLGWRPKWRLDEALNRTIDWHAAWKRENDMRAVSLEQIHAYSLAGAAAGQAR